jgi:hypothetical protein
MQAQAVIAQNSVNCPSEIQLRGFQKMFDSVIKHMN